MKDVELESEIQDGAKLRSPILGRLAIPSVHEMRLESGVNDMDVLWSGLRTLHHLFHLHDVLPVFSSQTVFS